MSPAIATIREYERRRAGEPGTLGGVVKQAAREGREVVKRVVGV